jgi:hypothetical protein
VASSGGWRNGRGSAAVPDRRLSTLLALVLPVLVLVSTSALVLSWRAELPEPVASHWNGEVVDRTTPLTTLVLIVGGIALLCAVGGWAIAYHKGYEAITRRIGVAYAVGLTTFLSGMLLFTLWIQRGHASADAVPGPYGPLAAALAAGGFAAALGALGMPPNPPVPEAVRHPRWTRVPTDPRLPWVRQVRSGGTTGLGAIAVMITLVVGLVTGSLLVLVPIAALVGLLLLALARVTVTIDADGLAARGWLGWPRLHVPAEEILEVHAAWVSPVRDYGGLGYRIDADEELALVVRAGEAVKVTRTGLRGACVSVDEAPLAAELLRAVARAAAPDPPTD